MKTYLEEAQDLYARGNKKEAFEKYRALLRVNPDIPEAWYGIALCVDDLKKKEACLQKAVELKPGYKEAEVELFLGSLTTQSAITTASEMTNKKIDKNDDTAPNERKRKDIIKNPSTDEGGKNNISILQFGLLLGIVLILIACVLLTLNSLTKNAFKPASNLALSQQSRIVTFPPPQNTATQIYSKFFSGDAKDYLPDSIVGYTLTMNDDFFVEDCGQFASVFFQKDIQNLNEVSVVDYSLKLCRDDGSSSKNYDEDAMYEIGLANGMNGSCSRFDNPTDSEIGSKYLRCSYGEDNVLFLSEMWLVNNAVLSIHFYMEVNLNMTDEEIYQLSKIGINEINQLEDLLLGKFRK